MSTAFPGANYLGNIEAIREHFTLLFGDRTWPEGVWVSVGSMPPGGGAWKVEGYFHPSDIEAGVQLAMQAAAKGRNVFVDLSPRRADVPRTGRGGKADVSHIAVLAADLDVDGPNHAIKNLPKDEEVRGWIARSPVPLSVVRSSGGYHVYMVLDTPFDPHTDFGKALVAGWGAWWKTQADTYGETARHIDTGPMTNIATTMRVVGSQNWKPVKRGEAPILVTAESYTSERVSLERAAELFPAPAPRTRERGTAQGAPSAGGGGTGRIKPIAEDSKRPGDRFARAVSVENFLRDALEADEYENYGFSLPRPDGTYDTGNSMTVYDDYEDGVLRVRVFGERTKELLGGAGPFTSFDLFVRSFIVQDGDDMADAVIRGAKFLTAWESKLKNDFEELPEWLRDKEPMDDKIRGVLARSQSKQWQPVEPQAAPLAEGGQQVPDAPAQTEDPWPRRVPLAEFNQALLLDAETLRENPIETVLEERGQTKYIAVLGGTRTRHGLWEESLGRSGAVVRERLHDYLIWRRASMTYLTIQENGDNEEATAPTHDVELVRSDLRRFVTKGMVAGDAHSPHAILNSSALSEAYVAEPDNSTRPRVINMIRILGEGASENQTVYTTCGFAWVEPHGPVWLAPGGSMTADGPTDSITVTAAAGSSKNALEPHVQAMGWPESLDMSAIQQAAGAIKSYQNIVKPELRYLTTAALAVLFASPLSLPSRSTLYLNGSHGSGKSVIGAGMYAFVAPITAAKRLALTSLINPTEAGVSQLASWHRHLPQFFDDHKKTKDRMRNSRVEGIVDGILRQIYTGNSSVRGLQSGGWRKGASTADSCALMTAEVNPPEGSGASRVIELQVPKGAVLGRDPRLNMSPVDVFDRDYALTGLTRVLSGGYYQYLARMIRDLGSWSAYQRSNFELFNKTWQDLSGDEQNRGTELGAVLLTGLKRFYEYAGTAGIVAQLPPWHVMEDDIKRATADGLEEGGDEAQAWFRTVIIDGLPSMLESQLGHIAHADGSYPVKYQLVGWRVDHDEPRPQGHLLAKFSLDHRRLIIPRAAIEILSRNRAGVDAPRGKRLKDEMYRAGADPSSDQSKYVKKSDGWGDNHRGFVFNTADILPGYMEAIDEHQAQVDSKIPAFNNGPRGPQRDLPPLAA